MVNHLTLFPIFGIFMICKIRCLTKICSLSFLNIARGHIALSRTQNCRFHYSACEQVETEYVKHDQRVSAASNQNLFKDESPYYFENGLRKVYPYYFPYSTHCKARWLRRSLVDIYCTEFIACRKEAVEQRILDGSVRVNGNIVDINYKLRNGDFITATTHKHELAVLAASIKVLHEDEDILVVDKPPSIPVHPCGLYRYNTIVFILGQHKKWQSLKVIHRLDRLTSGVLIFAKNTIKSREMHNEMTLRDIHKEYICLVEGEFPDGTILCEKPIKKVQSHMGISLVHPSGKMCITEFQKLSFNGKSSVVLCKPRTGRTHQLRVHLQYLGYPIVNDPLYNSYAFGPEKGKSGKFHKAIDQLLKDLLEEHSSKWWMTSISQKEDTNCFNILNLINLYKDPENEDPLNEKYKKDPRRLTYDKDCLFCQTSYRDPNQINLFMCLHAYRYQGEKWEFKTEMPAWALHDSCFA